MAIMDNLNHEKSGNKKIKVNPKPSVKQPPPGQTKAQTKKVPAKPPVRTRAK